MMDGLSQKKVEQTVQGAPKQEAVQNFETAEQLVAFIKANPELDRAFEDMAVSNSNIHLDFIQHAPKENYAKILEVVKRNAEARRTKKQNEQISIRTQLEHEMIGLLE